VPYQESASPLSTLVLILGAPRYGELIRQCGIDVWDFDDWKQPAQLFPRVGIAVLVGLWRGVTDAAEPRRTRAAPEVQYARGDRGLRRHDGAAPGLFVIYARDEQGPLGWQRARSVLLRYPVATVLAVMLVPIGVVVAELVVILITSWQGMFPFLILDMFPGVGVFRRTIQDPQICNYTRAVLPDSRFFTSTESPASGFQLTVRAPASLSLRPSSGKPLDARIDRHGLSAIRAMYSQVSTMVLFLFMALQARWLGRSSRPWNRNGRSRPLEISCSVEIRALGWNPVGPTSVGQSFFRRKRSSHFRAEPPSRCANRDRHHDRRAGRR